MANCLFNEKIILFDNPYKFLNIEFAYTLRNYDN